VTFGNPTMQELCNGRRRDAPGSGIPKGFQRCRRSTSANEPHNSLPQIKQKPAFTAAKISF